jgi:hypothetical protein
MSKMALLKISFAAPVHGWLAVSLSIDTSTIQFSASDVPNNPIEDLIDALHCACGNREALVWWHLEPGGYYFEFAPAGEGVQLRVMFAEDSNSKERANVITVRGSKQEVLLPIWRGLRQLQSFEAKEPHWPVVRYGTMDKLGEQLRAES